MNSRWMMMTSLVILISTGCAVPDEPVIRITDTFIPTADCAEDDIGITGVSVDLGLTNSVVMGFRYQSDVQPQETLSANGEELAGPRRNDVIFTEIEYNYESDTGLEIESGRKPIYFYAQSGSGEGSWIIVNLLTPEARETLSSSVLTADDATEVLVKIRFHGETSVGAKVETREVSMPVYVTRVFPGCPAGTVLTGEGPCGNIGQSGTEDLACDPI